MAFAPRPRTPVRRQSNETSGTGKETTSTPVRATPYAVASGASSANGTIQRLLDIVTQHGVQLAFLGSEERWSWRMNRRLFLAQKFQQG